MAVLLTGFSDGWRIDDWHQFLNVVAKHTVKELLIPVQEIHQVSVPVKITAALSQAVHNPLCLGLFAHYTWGQKSMQAKHLPLL